MKTDRYWISGPCIVAMLVLALATSCGTLVRDTLNVGNSPTNRGASITLSMPVGTGANAPGLFGKESAEFGANIIGVNGPFNIVWNFGGAAENTTSALAAAGTCKVEIEFFALDEEMDFTATATVTDSTGISQSDSVTFTVGPTQNIKPQLFLSISGNIIDAVASDPDGDPLEFSAVVESGDVSVSRPFDETPTSARFVVRPGSLFADVSFSIAVTADDGRGGAVTESIGHDFEAFPLEADTLYAIATDDRILTGQNVRIVVATGDTANSFQYMNGCGVVCENGASYNPRTFDVGDPDDTPDVGSANPIDGVWSDMGATSFLLAPDNFITATDLGNGTSRTDFNITPLGGSDITASGILFNFEYTFAFAGNYQLGFEETNIVSRTYYQDSSAATDFFWGNIANNHQYNTILVD